MAGSIQKTVGPQGTKYLVRVEMPTDPITKQRKQRSKSFRTKKEAERALAEWLVEIDRGMAIDGTKMTVAEYFDHWLRQHGHDIRPTTLQQYRSLIGKHIVPALGAIALTKLAPAHLTAFYAELRVSGRCNGQGGLSARTVRHIHTLIRTALGFAVKQQMVARNVADAIDPPRFGKREMTTWTAAEIQRFLAVAADHAYGPIWLLYITTGLRRGEGLGVRWRDIDFASGQLSVVQAVASINGRPTVQPPKTASSKRRVRLSPACLAALRQHRTHQDARRRSAARWQPLDLVFATSDGGPLDPRNLGRTFDLLQRKAGVPPITVHDLRHTHATMLFNDGQNIKMISQRLGHADVAITLSVYAHLAPDAQDTAASSIDRLISGAAAD